MKSGEFKDGMLVGAAIGFVIGLSLAGVGVYLWQQTKIEKVQEGWTLVPVIVFNRDLPAGATIDYDEVAKMQMPERFVTASVVAPKDFEQVVGRKLRYPVMRGDLVILGVVEPAPGEQPPP